jgi:hypothetical protein
LEEAASVPISSDSFVHFRMFPMPDKERKYSVILVITNLGT